MCGFLVYSETDIDLKEYEREFYKIKHRGPDMTRIVIGKGIFGFHRLSIMDLSEAGMQPFKYEENMIVCNGEIYNYLDLKKDLEIQYKSKSDCEILLPLYKIYEADFFKMLDGEFALCLYDKRINKFIAGRDPIGIRPMFYGYSKVSNSIMFASEVKAINELCSEVYPFPPGHYYDGEKFIRYYDPSKASTYINDSLKDITTGLNKRLTKGIEKMLPSDAPIGFLLSGGLDSSLVCSIASKKLDMQIKTFSIGMEKDAIDLKYAKEVAEFIKSDHTEVIISKDDVLNSIEEVIYKLESWDITTIRASIGMYLICKYIREQTDIRVVLTGEISDELFGYKYTDFAPSESEFQKESMKRIKEIFMYDVLRADRCIAGNSLEARVPFGDLDFVDYVMSINPSKKINSYGQGKYLLRKAFEGDYLPNNILYREKAAFSDAVGHSLVDYIKEYAEKKFTDNEFEERRKKYNNKTPFTKESLLYREIFEKYYSNRESLIVDFWMPNKEWDGCNVKDPSARVLDNYGESGE
ncbi:asparagine synthase B [Mycoplasmatota bacterium]|nr:asparagine synthase B [Mycoplasmatota bacterium]